MLNLVFVFLAFFLLIPAVYAYGQKAVLHSDRAQVNNTSIIGRNANLYNIWIRTGSNIPAGIIKNIGNETKFKIELILSLLDSNNKLIGVENSIPEIDHLNANDTTPYKIKVNSNIFKP